MEVTEVVETQSTIISMQSRVINKLFQMLGNYMTVDELDNLPVVGVINEAAGLKERIGGWK
jgi:hypothetical protein